MTSESDGGAAGSVLFSDQPLVYEGEDLLDRGPFTSTAARLLDRLLDREASTVAAVVGPWGSGKSSTVNFTLGRMRRPDGVVRLDPWMVGGPTAVTREVVTAVTRALRGVGLAKADVSAIDDYFRAALVAGAHAGVALGGTVLAMHGIAVGPAAAAVIGDVSRALATTDAERRRVKNAAAATLEEALDAVARLLHPDAEAYCSRSSRPYGCRGGCRTCTTCSRRPR